MKRVGNLNHMSGLDAGAKRVGYSNRNIAETVMKAKSIVIIFHRFERGVLILCDLTIVENDFRTKIKS